MNYNDVRKTADRVRAVSLENVLSVLGAQPDRRDKARWHTKKGVLSVTGHKFMNWNQGGGGGGAIDLVIHLEDLGFLAAVEWLSRHFPGAGAPECTAPTAKPSARRLALPRPDATKLSLVTRYLVQERGLRLSVIEPLIEAGRIYADERENAVFVMREENGGPVGAELRGTTTRPWRGMAPGSRKDLGYFSVAPPSATSIILCESAIDALSCFLLCPTARCVSTAGARPNPRWLVPLLQSHDVRCGFDADPTGDYMARAMIALHPTVTRLRPPHHDWNDVLRHQT